MVAEKDDGFYVMACFDIDRFRVINDQYGTKKGDDVLKYIANVFSVGFGEMGGITCRVAADNFAVLYPASEQDSVKIADMRRKASSVDGLVAPISFSIGRYVVSDRTISPSAMLDRASLAAESVKGRFKDKIAYYDEAMRSRLIMEQEIVTEMAESLKARQFEAWYQPQYNHTTGALVGSEALVRWRHPVKGLVSPGIFVPIFEKNGFIYELDKFVWEEACRSLADWRERGLSPLPVSVNISRYDIFMPDMVETIIGLIKKYDLPASMLRLEITESAFAENTDVIISVVKSLIDYGFTMEIDDFGSGYSSLNTLKSVPAQVLKLDMRFMEDSGDTERGGNIIESIVRMTKWLGMSVIAEGVEKKEQADYLASIGCKYIQGYLYAKPMPKAEFEKALASPKKEIKLRTMETIEHLDNNSLWDPKSLDSLIFNSYIGSACIFECHSGKIEILRASEKYAEMLGLAGMTIDDALALNWAAHMDDNERHELFAALYKSLETQQEVTRDITFISLPGCRGKVYLHSTMRVIASTGDRYLVYCINQNITAQREAESKERLIAGQLKAVMDNVNCGITAVSLKDGNVKYLLANNRYYDILGYSPEQYRQEVGNMAFTTLYAEDAEYVRSIVTAVSTTGKPAVLEYRAVRRDGRVIWLRSQISMTEFEQEGKVQLTTYTDITNEKNAQKELLDNLPGGAALFEIDDGKMRAVHINKRYWELVGRSPVAYDSMNVLGSAHPADREQIRDEIALAIKENREASLDFRLLYGNDEETYRPFHVHGRIVPKGGRKYALYAIYTPITDEAMSIREMLPVVMRAMMDTQTGFSFVKDSRLRYLCVSRDVCAVTGYSDENDVIGKTDSELLGAENAADFERLDRLVLESGESLLDYVNTLTGKDGMAHYYSTSKFPLKDSHGNIIGIYGMGRDITEEREIKSRLELLTDNIPGGIASFERIGGQLRLTYFNDGFLRLFGLTREECLAHGDVDVIEGIDEEDIALVKKQFYALEESGERLDAVFKAHMKDGGYKWLNLKAVRSIENGGKPIFNAVLFDITARQDALDKLRVSEEENRLAIAHSKTIVCRFDVASRTLHISPHASSIYDAPESMTDLPLSQVRQGSVSPDTAEDYIAFYDSIIRGEKSGRVTFKRMSEVGWRWLSASFSTIFSFSGEPVSAVISFADVTDEREKDAVYGKWRQSLQGRDSDGYSLYRCNLSRHEMFGEDEGTLIGTELSSSEKDFGARMRMYSEMYVFSEDAERFNAFISADSLLSSYYQGRSAVVIEYRDKKDGGDGTRWLRLTVEMMDAPGKAEVEAYLLFEDIDSIKREELSVEERTQIDSLTGALNRSAFESQVNYIIETSKPGTHHALLALDIDGFGQVNEAFGHSAGDQALADIAASIRTALRHNDLVGRLQDDEFVVFLTDIPGDSIAAVKARQICALTRKSYSTEVETTGSIGITVTPRDGTDFASLYNKADIALYNVKGAGKDSYSFYHGDMMKLERDAFEDAAEIAPIVPAAQRERKRRMLIVDDSQIAHAMLSNIFAAEFIIEKARDGRTALIRLSHYGAAISVVLLDLMMPGMDGFAVLEKMQKSPELRTIPVVVVSGDGNRETSLRAIRAGASDYVTKPYAADVLKIRVKSAISKAENERLRAKNSMLEYRNGEIRRYKTVLERENTIVIENDWLNGAFIYDENISRYLAGKYDKRQLWHILLADSVADTETVKRFQGAAHDLAASRERQTAELILRLRTPNSVFHWFKAGVYKVANDYGLTGRLYIALTDLGEKKPS